ncbi:LysR family transcriptional regulator [uncultured Bacteroides sp.]|uniref:LysR family transcriptional regulator n=1 Tax=uncultured Bacteroides sp. TaxID=162156 RepID=UPI002AA7F37F|nr:LysR family transcriptional regulator [uncultured Bacteroides sp.]
MSDFRLKVFLSVAKNLSFTKASQELFISQPAITKHIQELEVAYQTRLFDRLGNKILLTASGQLLLDHSERILEDYKRLEYEMHLLHNECTGELRIGASTTIAQYVLPPLLASFIDKFPQVTLSLINGNSREIETALQEHRIDLGLVEGIFRLPNLKYIDFLEDELVAIVHPGNKLTLGDEILPEDLQHIPLVLRERGSGTLDVFEKALMQHNIKLSSLNVLLYLGSTESIKLFLTNSDCMGIVSVRSIGRELFAGLFRVIEIKGMPMMRSFCFTQLQGQEPESGLPQVFMQFAHHYSKKL